MRRTKDLTSSFCSAEFFKESLVLRKYGSRVGCTVFWNAKEMLNLNFKQTTNTIFASPKRCVRRSIFASMFEILDESGTVEEDDVSSTRAREVHLLYPLVHFSRSSDWNLVYSKYKFWLSLHHGECGTFWIDRLRLFGARLQLPSVLVLLANGRIILVYLWLRRQCQLDGESRKREYEHQVPWLDLDWSSWCRVLFVPSHSALQRHGQATEHWHDATVARWCTDLGCTISDI